MSPLQYIDASDESEVHRLCKAANTSVANFGQIARFGGNVSGKLAVELSRASRGQMSVEDIISPDDPEMAKARAHRRQMISARAMRRNAPRKQQCTT